MDTTEQEADACEPGLNPQLFEDAAKGSADAQRALRDEALEMAITGRAQFSEAFSVAEAFARLAVVHGHPDDAVILASLLFKRAQLLAPTEGHAAHSIVEAVVMANRAADGGREDAAALVSSLADIGVSPELLDVARQMARSDNDDRSGE